MRNVRSCICDIIKKMFADTSLVLAFIYIFFIGNIFGWGYLHEKEFLVFASFLGILYLVLSAIASGFGKKIVFVKALLVLVFIGVSVFAVTGNLIFLRNRSLDINYISDSALQAELAGKFIIEGENPYVKDYDQTTLAKWPYADEAGRTVNPAIYHNVIPPSLLIASATGFRIFSRVFGFFDVRLIYLAALFSLVVLGFIKYKLSKQVLLFLILVCMNPLFNINLIKGTNDVVVLALLLWCVFFLEKKRVAFAAILLGISLATKQTAWFVVPFYFLYSYQLFGKKGLRNFVGISIVVGALFYVPFFLDNFDRTFKSLVFYPTSHTSGNATTHPIEGFGFSQVLHTFGYIKSIYDPFPFWLFQLGAGIASIGFLMGKYRKKITGSQVLLSSAVVTGVVWYFNRYFLETHLAYLLVLVAASYVWSLSEKEE